MTTVLIVDDRAVNRDLVRTVLGYHGYETVEAEDGPGALSVLHGQHPDLVVADVLMPGMDGYELARAIRADPGTRDIPVVFYTANYVESEIRQIAKAVGVNRVVTKSGDLTELLDAVHDSLGTKPAPMPTPRPEDFDREHLRVLNAKLIEKVSELEQAARLHQMLDAIVAVGDELTLPPILERIATSAHAIVAATHTAVATHAAEGRPPHWVHIGADAATARRLQLQFGTGNAPGAGDLAQLGYTSAPISIGGEACATLLFRRRSREPLAEGDRAILDTLTRAAGVAIANSQLYDDARRRQAWLAASADVATALLSADPAKIYALVAAAARRVLGAQVGWVEFARGDTLHIVGADGPLATALPSSIPLAAAVLFDDVRTTGQAVVLDDVSADARLMRVLPPGASRIGPLLGVPLTATGHNHGVLFVANSGGGPRFTPLDVEMARAFAARSAQTIEFARAEADRRRLTVLEDRNRIARDLHDVVIQRLFGLGLGLQRMRADVPETAGAYLGHVIAELDDTIDEIRNTIFSLRVLPEARDSVRAEVMGIVQPGRSPLESTPRLRFEGPVDTTVPPRIRAHLLATLTEALSNVRRHAEATDVEVLVRVDDADLTVRVTDNGRGLPAVRTESGLANLRQRAADLGGRMEVGAGSGDGPGTVLTWMVPLHADTHADAQADAHTDARTDTAVASAGGGV
jgi:signal transduction histidine kinase/CheY-like chemotaxis protein